MDARAHTAMASAAVQRSAFSIRHGGNHAKRERKSGDYFMYPLSDTAVIHIINECAYMSKCPSRIWIYPMLEQIYAFSHWDTLSGSHKSLCVTHGAGTRLAVT